jgi:hypothetical protein
VRSREDEDKNKMGLSLDSKLGAETIHVYFKKKIGISIRIN